MKKHNMMRVASALAVVTLLSTSVISGTLAKYTSEEQVKQKVQESQSGQSMQDQKMALCKQFQKLEVIALHLICLIR